MITTMRKTITTLIDDLDGTDASETVRFALDGTSYEIDLSEKNAAALRDAVAPYTMRAKTAGSQRRTRTTLRSAGASRSAEIRAWAASADITVPARGRVPTAVVQAFDAAH